MKAAERLAKRAALVDVGAAGAHALQECADHGGLAVNFPQRISILRGNGKRRGEAFRGKVSHHAHEEGKIFLLHLSFENSEDVTAFARLQQEVGVLHAFGNALERQRRAEIILGQQRVEGCIINVCIDGHDAWLGGEAVTRKRGVGLSGS